MIVADWFIWSPTNLRKRDAEIKKWLISSKNIIRHDTVLTRGKDLQRLPYHQDDW